MDTLMNTPSRLSLVATLSTFLQGQLMRVIAGPATADPLTRRFWKHA
jgi:hypothetical protein